MTPTRHGGKLDRNVRARGRDKEQFVDVKIKVSDDGPYLVEGPVDLSDGQGSSLADQSRKVIALCRCGRSSNKPYCDGTHSKEGFKSAVRAGSS